MASRALWTLCTVALCFACSDIDDAFEQCVSEGRCGPDGGTSGGGGGTGGGGGIGGGGGAGGGGGGGAPALTVVRTTEYLRPLTPTASSVVELEPGLTVSVHVLDAGVWMGPFAGVVNADAGTFALQDLPAGKRYVRLSHTTYEEWLVATGAVLDYGETKVGRPEKDPVPLGSQLVATFSPSLRFAEFLPVYLAGTSPIGGSAFVGPDAGSLTFAFNGPSFPELVHKGDQTFLLQRVSGSLLAEDGGSAGGYSVVAKVCAFGPLLEMVSDGGVTTAPCSELGGTTSQRLDLDHSSFVAMAAQMYPAAPPPFVPVVVQTAATLSSPTGNTASIVQLLNVQANATLADAGFVLPSGFSAPIALTTSATLLVSSTVSTTAGDVSLPIQARQEGVSTAGTIQPRLLPVRQPSIEGELLFDGGTHRGDGGLTPTLGWLPPSGPVLPTHYTVELREVITVPSLQLTPIAYFTVDEPRLPFPPGVLGAGKEYLFVISSRRHSAPLTTPNRRGASSDWTDLVTDTFRP